MFTLFRALTGEDWTDLRYNLITASQHGVVKVSPTVITSYHILWFVLSAFLLLNLVVGAIVNNYQIAMDIANIEEKITTKKNYYVFQDIKPAISLNPSKTMVNKL